MSQVTSWKETGKYCRICGNIMIHILVKNEWICCGHNDTFEVRNYDEQIIRLFSPKTARKS